MLASVAKGASLSRALPVFNERADFYIGWGRKKSGRNAQRLAAKYNKPFYLLEDGLIRSIYTPKHSKSPLSIVIDDIGIYYDARTQSRLEKDLQSAKKYSAETKKRARNAINFLRDNKLSKYNHASDNPPANLPQGYILLIDQTYGDLSIAGAMANEDDFGAMLNSAIAEHTHKPIVIKIHPQVIMGRKKGYLYNAYNALPKNKRANIHIISDDVNPFTLIEGAAEVYTVSSQMGFEALLCGKKVRCFGVPFYTGWGITRDEKPCPRRTKKRKLEELFAAFYFDYTRYFNPLSGQASTFEDIAELLTLWRDHNQAHSHIAACLYISQWKRPAINAFLGTQNTRPHYFAHEATAIEYAANNNAPIYAWSSKITDTLTAACAEKNIEIIRIEDGFIRSAGLGAKLTLPCSLCFDSAGIYYDARTASDLENILQNTKISKDTCVRAKILMERIKNNGLSKYNLKTEANDGALTRKITAAKAPKTILVPGQVEDDASVLYGGDDIRNNLDLLKAVRTKNKDAFIIYKPHPDVMAGLRAGHLARDEIKKYADVIEADRDIIALINLSDEIHVNTSLTGFEALLRGKIVHTYGMPFYAGWGLTIDTVKCKRRTKKLSLEELVAGTLILYPRYIHPSALKPCRAEDVVDYLATNKAKPQSAKTFYGFFYSAYGRLKNILGGTK